MCSSDLCRESNIEVGTRIARLLRPVIPSLLVARTTSRLLCFRAGYDYLYYNNNRKISFGDVLETFFPDLIGYYVYESIWITDDEMHEIHRILEEAL